MKTYICFVNDNGTLKMVATKEKSLKKAEQKLQSKGMSVHRSSTQISACDLDYVTCEKVM